MVTVNRAPLLSGQHPQVRYKPFWVYGTEICRLFVITGILGPLCFGNDQIPIRIMTYLHKMRHRKKKESRCHRRVDRKGIAKGNNGKQAEILPI